MILSEHREICDFLELGADQAARGEKVAPSRPLEAEYHTILLLQEQKDYLLSEARSELVMQELRVESADRALQESGLQHRSQRMELCQANHRIIPGERRTGYAQNWTSYQKLKTMVKRCTDEKIRTRNFRARNERLESVVLVKTQKKKECQR